MQQHNLQDSFNKIVKAVQSDPQIIDFLKQHQNELEEDALEKSIAKLYEFHSVSEKLKSHQASFAPGYLPKLVVSDHLIDVTYTASPEVIAKQKESALSKRVTTIAMPKDIRNASIDNFDNTQERFNALSESLKFITDMTADDGKFHPGLYLYGPFGVGKTYLLGAISNELAKRNISSTMVHFPSFAVEMKAAISTNSVTDKIDLIKKSPVLMIDDVGADAMSSWVRDEVLGVILEYRMQQQLPTFFSSNFSMKQLEEEHLKTNQYGDNEPLKAMRLMQRIRFLSKEVEMRGNNRRQQN